MSMYALDNQLNYYRLECEKLKQENERISSDLAIAEKFIEAKDRILDQIQQENARLREFIKSQMNKCEHTGYGIKNCSYCIQFKKALEASV